jgi:hypothetical protein
MTQEWFMNNGYSLVNDYQHMVLRVYYDDVVIHEEKLITSGDSMPKIKADLSVRNFYEYIYPICQAHKRNLTIRNIFNDSDIGYDQE